MDSSHHYLTAGHYQGIIAHVCIYRYMLGVNHVHTMGMCKFMLRAHKVSCGMT